MSLLKKLCSGLRWFAPIHRWTAAVTIALAGGTFFGVVAVGLGLTDVARAPSEVVVAMYQAAQDGQPEVVRKFLSDDARERFDRLPPEDETALINLLSKDSTTVALTSIGVRNYGKNAVTGLIQDMSSGLSDLRVEVLAREGRYWRVEWPVGVAEFSESVQRFDPYYVPSKTGDGSL